MTYASCHFYSCFAKKCLCVCVGGCVLSFVFCFFMFVCFRHLPFCSCLCKPVLAVCVSDVKGEEHECNPPPLFLTDF